MADEPGKEEGAAGVPSKHTGRGKEYVVFFSAARAVVPRRPTMAFKVDRPAQAGGAQWLLDLRNGPIGNIMQRCFDAKKRCRVWIANSYPAPYLGDQTVGEVYQAEESAEPY